MREARFKIISLSVGNDYVWLKDSNGYTWKFWSTDFTDLNSESQVLSIADYIEFFNHYYRFRTFPEERRGWVLIDNKYKFKKPPANITVHIAKFIRDNIDAIMSCVRNGENISVRVGSKPTDT